MFVSYIFFRFGLSVAALYSQAHGESCANCGLGCVTCKARRVKCDETKPACNQCARRHLTCGGYRKDIRFRPIERPLLARGQASPDLLATQQNHILGDEQALSDPTISRDDGNTSNGEMSSSLPPWPFSSGGSLDFDFSDLDVDQSWTIFQQPETTSLDADTLNFHRIEGESEHNAPRAQEGAVSAFDTGVDTILLSPFPSPSTEVPNILLVESPDSVLEDSERLSLLFQEQTRQVLSLYDDSSKNPWTKFVWPMVKDSNALYYAVSAMTYLQHSKSNYSARQKGLLLVRRSKEALEDELNSGSLHMESAIATTIALGFAEAWDYGASTTGRAHFNDARRLLQKSLSDPIPTRDSSAISARLKFLANTWIYMDVIFRLTSDCGKPTGSEILSLFGIDEPQVCGEDMDPLMGYASTLFPVIGRVADLVAEIRLRVLKRNSPVIISRAIELRQILETWTPAIDLEQVDDPTQIMSDAIQTAEAYRWSTLLLLQQAVPELPNLGSVGEYGQRVLVYLATIPMTSQTAIVHTYPLMIAGTEAIEEDREFVRERWRMMSKRMIPGIVDRCLEITEEVWRRRDAYLLDFEAWSPTDVARTRLASPVSRPGSTDNGARPLDPDITRHAIHSSSVSATAKRSSPMTIDFPISAAFKKGVDPLTRSGYVEYTVKGRLHWFGVMKDWGWEGEYMPYT
jgi:hypothetical protein